jgi:hypothetical protein
MAEKKTPDPLAAAAAAGLSIDDVRKGLVRLLPVLKTIAALTPNTFDDAAVAFIESLLAAKVS